jgi:Asp-tRNA(Asn)/Glu-tRNA(Gln) amidotransferase A subunit family amidase
MMTKTIKIIFTLSILLNVVLIGLVGGCYYKKFKRQSYSHFGFTQNEMVAEKMEKSREEMREKYKKMRDQLEALESLIVEPEFNQDKYSQAVEGIIDTKNDMARRKAMLMGEVLSDMSLEERQKMSKNITRSLSWRHKEGRGSSRDKSQ